MAKLWKECQWCGENYNPDDQPYIPSLFCSCRCSEAHDLWYWFIVVVLARDDGSIEPQ